MSGRPVPRGLRVLTPHGTVFYVDAAVASWARSDREQPSRRLLPGSWIASSDHLRRIGANSRRDLLARQARRGLRLLLEQSLVPYQYRQ
jgi:hypothetical protein